MITVYSIALGLKEQVLFVFYDKVVIINPTHDERLYTDVLVVTSKHCQNSMSSF